MKEMKRAMVQSIWEDWELQSFKEIPLPKMQISVEYWAKDQFSLPIS